MDKKIWTGNCKGIKSKSEMTDNLAMKNDELAEFDGELENMSDILQEYVDLQYNAE